MGKYYDEITPELADWLGQQRMFFVATAPLAADGLLNCSPKGTDGLTRYRCEKNAPSLDGLPGLEPEG